jgi:hypothetical protein
MSAAASYNRRNAEAASCKKHPIHQAGPGVASCETEDGQPDLALEYLREQDRRRGVPGHITDRRALEDGAALLGGVIDADSRRPAAKHD